MAEISSPRNVINQWASIAQFAADIDVGYEAAKAMRRRNSIPAEYWSRVLAAAEQRGITGVTPESLTLMHAKAPSSPSQPERVVS